MLTRAKTLQLALPIIAAQAATATTGIVDTLVMGRFGDKVDLAAVAIAAVTYSFIYWGFGFLRMSTTGLTAQAAGREDEAEKRAVLLRALLLGGARQEDQCVCHAQRALDGFERFLPLRHRGLVNVFKTVKGVFNMRGMYFAEVYSPAVTGLIGLS